MAPHLPLPPPLFGWLLFAPGAMCGGRVGENFSTLCYVQFSASTGWNKSLPSARPSLGKARRWWVVVRCGEGRCSWGRPQAELITGPEPKARPKRTDKRLESQPPHTIFLPPSPSLCCCLFFYCCLCHAAICHAFFGIWQASETDQKNNKNFCLFPPLLPPSHTTALHHVHAP